jgi:hypothetical protein
MQSFNIKEFCLPNLKYLICRFLNKIYQKISLNQKIIRNICKSADIRQF